MARKKTVFVTKKTSPIGTGPGVIVGTGAVRPERPIKTAVMGIEGASKIAGKWVAYPGYKLSDQMLRENGD